MTALIIDGRRDKGLRTESVGCKDYRPEKKEEEERKEEEKKEEEGNKEKENTEGEQDE